MKLGAKMEVAFIGAIVGSIFGGIAGLAGGLIFTDLGGTSTFEGYSGFIVVYWMLAGILFGAIAGIAVVIAKVRKPSAVGRKAFGIDVEK